MRTSPTVLLLLVMLGCGSETQPEKLYSDSGGTQTQQPKVASLQKQAATRAEKLPPEKFPPEKLLAEKRPPQKLPAEKPAPVVKKLGTTDQPALGDPIVNSVGMLLMPIPAGQFQMGSPDSDSAADDDEQPQHLVKITKPFYLGVTEVTQGQWESVMHTRPWQGKTNGVQEGRDYPASYVSWEDAAEFCRELSEQEGVEYRLPTEAQWEYACRAGTTTVRTILGMMRQSWDGTPGTEKNALAIGEQYGHRVGQKLPNSWGLYDMHGNVFEWCQDWFAPYAGEKPTSDSQTLPQNDRRVLRGGAFSSLPVYVRSANRYTNLPDNRNYDLSFRVARTYRASP